MLIEQKDINKKIYFLENEEEIEKETSESIKIKDEIEEDYDLEVIKGDFMETYIYEDLYRKFDKDDDKSENIEIKNNSNDNFKELNKLNAKLFINNKEFEYNKYFIPKNIGKYIIKLKFNINLTDCSYMFADCKNIIKINFISFKTKYLTNMSYMFYKCKNLKNINLFSVATNNVKDMSYMFYECNKLTNLDLSSFKTEKVIDISYMFYGCNNMKYLDISSFDAKKVRLMSYIFYGCNNLKNTYIPFFKENEINILVKVSKSEIYKKIYFLGHLEKGKKKKLKELNKLNTELYINNKKFEYERYFIPKSKGEYNIKLKFNFNLTDCGYMFPRCENIIEINFTNFNSKYITNMERMFYRCIYLKTINLSPFNTENVTNMRSMFSNCYNLKDIDLSLFNTKNVNNMSYMFHCCFGLKSLDLSSFNTKNVTDMSFMFYHCKNLMTLNVSSFDIRKDTKILSISTNCTKILDSDLHAFHRFDKKIMTK